MNKPHLPTRRSLIGAAGLGLLALPRLARANMPAPPTTRGYAKGPYGLVHYQDTGPAKNAAPGSLPLVLCHQAPMSSRQFDSVYGRLLARGIRAIGIDTPGFGMSDVTPFVPKVEDWAKAVPPVLDHLGLKQVDILGHHTGSMVATEVALQFPDRVRNLILNGPLPVTDDERKNFLDGVEKREKNFVYKSDGSHLMESFMGRWRMYGEGANPQLTTRVTVEKFMGYGPFWYGHYAAFMYNHNASIPKIKHRTLILTNTGDQIYENAKRTKQMRPDFAFVEFQGGGVDIVDQNSDAWADAVAAFVKG
ncbi:MAG: alpha/beta hydrolase [Rhodospirillaceae bacterium]|nr:alpha/beta hydrolase [Rhodospirillaceae bacterium]